MSFDTLTPATRDAIRDTISRERLPEHFLTSLEQAILPCANLIARMHDDSRSPTDTQKKAPIWGINGAQGTGKSTLVQFLALILKHQFGLRAVALSIDDFYLSRAARKELSEQIHPLLATRGVPGTHDVHLGCATLDKLAYADDQSAIPLPRFDKALDDIVPPEHWPSHSGPVDIILFEGWCVGTTPQPAHHLVQPINGLEADEDADGSWRTYVNDALGNEYRDWYQRITHLVLLRCPGFEQVQEWRTLQENRLRDRLVAAGKPLPETLMNAKQIVRFIQHYQRLTEWNLTTLPRLATVVLELQKNHQITDIVINPYN
ncbi:MAG: hypothetical protein MI864_08250 [Pseudomonadales bacterium]|uniref:Phosphoribulokinase/Uridine kinase Family protein n=1 Tax=Oleiphilus messinensis TaxID=141451 RepID=A0A1Y0I2F9_9GAMM|nr:hypothetical protein [Oleiphilus messinensis]ARU54652.1 phosphoribulokinase/Uridine kinase Family protein [Oleiphilus messinensis]MCG8610512.1 hypothetical protein [Pseudomonadales bacterium]